MAVDKHHRTKEHLCYKRGDVVHSADDGWGWGKEELRAPANGGLFCVIKIPNVPKVNYGFLFREHPNGVRRKTRLMLDSMLPLKRKILEDFGELVVSEEEFHVLLSDKV